MEKLCKPKKKTSNFYTPISAVAHLCVLGILLGGSFFSERAILAADGDNSIKAVMIDLSMMAAPEQSLVEDSPQLNSPQEPEVEVDNEVTEIVQDNNTKPDVAPDIIVEKEVIEKLAPVKDAQLVVAEKLPEKEQKAPSPVKKSSVAQVKQEVKTDKIAETAVAPTISSNTQFAATPSAINRKFPEYPRKALDMRIEGHVIVLFDIGVHGNVENIRILESKPNSIFNRSVIQAMKQWKYQPIKAKDLTVKIVFNRNKSINIDKA